jgi:hypothetical protein
MVIRASEAGQAMGREAGPSHIMHKAKLSLVSGSARTTLRICEALMRSQIYSLSSLMYADRTPSNLPQCV